MIISKKHIHMSPSQTIMAGFAAMILIGAILLRLPIASKDGISFIDALFTATSANCVTGLVVVGTATHWTLFGKLVILALIQLGGLGFMTVLTLAMITIRRKISLRSRLTIRASFNQDDIGGMVRLVKKVIKITLFFETAGAVLLAALFLAQGYSLSRSVTSGIFHSISAFCNAGFDIIGSESLIPFQTHALFNLVIMLLIVSGGLGFTVWMELIAALRSKKRASLRLKLRHLSLHTKIVFLMTAALILLGAVFFLLFEWNNPLTLGNLRAPEKGLAALFQSVTLRTAGFNTIPQSDLTEISKFTSCLFMLIGGSSVSTAGGMKTVTIGVILISMYSLLRGRSRMESLGRTLPLDLLQKALTVVATMLIVVAVSTILLHFTEQSSPYRPNFLDILYETCSAAGTVGLTTGLTPHLSFAGKIVIIVCMYLGRLSPVTVVVALNNRLHTQTDAVTLPVERVIIG